MLSNRGLDVTRLQNTGKKGGNPDLDIGGRHADVYSPKSKNPNTIWDNMSYKVEHQASDIVLNLSRIDGVRVIDFTIDGVERQITLVVSTNLGSGSKGSDSIDNPTIYWVICFV